MHALICSNLAIALIGIAIYVQSLGVSKYDQYLCVALSDSFCRNCRFLEYIGVIMYHSLATVIQNICLTVSHRCEASYDSLW